MQLLDPTFIRDTVDYSFGDDSGLQIGGYIKPVSKDNAEFMESVKEYIKYAKEYDEPMTLFIDNIRLYHRRCSYTAIEQMSAMIAKIKDEKVQMYAHQDLLKLCATMPDIRFVIFTGFEDTPIDEQIIVPHNVIAVYASNAIVFGGKVHPIPYGLQRKFPPTYRYEKKLWRGRQMRMKKITVEDDRHDILASMVDNNTPASKLLYLNFSQQTNPIRVRLYDQFQWATCVEKGEITDYRTYLTEIKQHKFVLCPSGNAIGCECHRDWETIYMRRVPVVIDSPYLREIFKDFPVLFVRSFDEVTPSLLIGSEVLYDRMQELDVLQMLDMERLFMDWINRVA